MEKGELRALVGRAVDDLADGFVLVEGTASDGIARRIIFVNRAFTKLTGFTYEEAIGRTPDITIGPETDREALVRIKEARDAVGSARVELLKYRKDGSTFWCEMDLIPVFDEAGNFTNYCSYLRDVTERRERQMRVLETERLAAIGTLAAGVAHEMNNPLAYALMNVGFLEDELPALVATAKDPKLARWSELANTLAEVRHGVSRVAQIVRDIRAFSRPDAGGKQRCRLPVLIERAVHMARAGMPACARVATHYDHTHEVVGDPGRFAQVFLNLVVNALDAIPAAESAQRGVEVRAFNLDGHVMVEVRDEGIGIPADVLPRIFDPFFTTKDTGKGTGLGLSVSYGIVKAAGGTMTVESKVGVGTCVRVALPAAKKISEMTEAEAKADGAELRLRILVVDDEPMIGRALRRSLAGKDDVVVCLSAQDALDLLAASRDYHLILCDLSMPGMTGATLYSRIATQWPELAARVVIMTGGASDEPSRQFLESAPCPHLDKPVDLHVLRKMLETIRTSYPQLPA